MYKDLVLLAITDDNLYQTLKQDLTLKGFTVLRADSEKEIINIISDKKPSILILDTKLADGTSGIETAKKIKKNSNLPVIFLSDSVEDEIFNKAKKVNPINFFARPFESKDITRAIELGIENHKLQKQITDDHNKYELVIKAARAGVYEIDPSTFEIDADESLPKIFGYTKAEVKELGWGNLMPIEDFNKKKELLSNLLQGKIHTYSTEHRIIKKDGSIAWAVSSGSLSVDSNGNTKIVGTLTDITKRKTAEEKLKEYSEELKKSNSAKDKFFSIISHDLRNPFNSLLGFSELLANNIEDLTEQEVKDSAKTLNRTANHLFNLLTNLLEWSRLQTGNFTMEKMDFTLSVIINYILDIYSTSISEKQLNIVKETDCGINLFADRNMIEAAVRNIISNAIKYSRNGGTIKVGCRTVDDRAEVYVEDKGVGIAKEDQVRLFKIEKQFSTEGTNYERGTGFGLLLTKELVEKNKGTITFTSEKDKGSTFIISLPLNNNN